MRLVLDKEAVVAALRTPIGASAAIIRAARERQVTLLASLPLVLEYQAICYQPRHLAVFGLKTEKVDKYLIAINALVEPVEAHFLCRPQLRDAGDETVLECAIKGRADAIVTFNVRDYANAPPRFGVEVLLPSEAISRIKR